MKKHLLLLMALCAITFYACKKDNTPANAVMKNAAVTTKSPLTSTSYYYNDLVLQPRQPGENFDTYLGNWGGISIKMMGSPVWDHDLYPNLQNGVPAYNATYAVTDLNYVTNTPSSAEDIFTVSVATMASTDFQAFQNDVSNFTNAYSAYVNLVSQGAQNVSIPKAGDYIKDSYNAGQAGYVAHTGKLIRVTTGSHWAIATVDYPLPAVATPQANSIALAFVIDPNNSSIRYELYGLNGVIRYLTNNGLTNSGATVTGTFSATPTNSTNFHCIGKITRSDGTNFSFDVTQDIY